MVPAPAQIECDPQLWHFRLEFTLSEPCNFLPFYRSYIKCRPLSNGIVEWLIICSELLHISGGPSTLHLSEVTFGKRPPPASKMPPSKPKPSEIAAEAKKTYIPYIRQNYNTQWPAQSFLCHSDALVAQPPQVTRHCRFGEN